MSGNRQLGSQSYDTLEREVRGLRESDLRKAPETKET
jgi:hypothetical protein